MSKHMMLSANNLIPPLRFLSLVVVNRVTSYVRTDNGYFIYPGKNEIWAIYCPAAKNHYFVVTSTYSKSAWRLTVV